MSPWAAWSQEAFARARTQGKPILAALGPLPPRDLAQAESEIARSFVAILADPQTRPDVAARIGRGRAVILDVDGARRAVLTLPEPALGAALARLALEAGTPRPASTPAEAWTGAVRETPLGAAPDAARVSVVFEALPKSGAEGTSRLLDLVEALLHAAGERGDAAARAALTAVLEARLAGWDPARRPFPLADEGAAEGSPVSAHARWARLLWDAHALTGEARWRDAAASLSERLARDFFDSTLDAFRREPSPECAVYPAEGNAQAAIALMRARAFNHPGAGETAEKALAFLQMRLYDPLLGLLHARGGDGEKVYGLLGDAAWTALAFTDAFLLTGIKAHREFADAMLRFLFQELWEREAGGFLDRVSRADDPAILREPHLDPALNAVALEVCLRLHHLKGNHNYRRWLEWGLRGAWPAAEADAPRVAGLARVAGLHARGRMDFELVGRLGEAKASALLAAAHRLYLPRKVISFVDPDDQDYILAHRLEAETYPRLFACGCDLRRIADAAEPSGVPALAAALREAR
ncbi:MAG: hypothetical protein HYZ74_09505 [Elusimicrobia bacterium]|nr:hypothetical protein [Elusimicrobiota bacterium]